VSEDLVTVLQLNAEHRIGQRFDHATLDLDGTVFLGHYVEEILRVL
jgi:hypothetical protein